MIVVYPLIALLVLQWSFIGAMRMVESIRRDRKIEVARRYRIKNNIPEPDLMKMLEETLGHQPGPYDENGYPVRPEGWYFCDPATVIAEPDRQHSPQGPMLPPFPDRPAVSERL